MNHIIDRVSFGSLMGKFIKQLQNKIATALNVPMWQLFASPEEVTKETKSELCPHCGQPIAIKTTIEKAD